MNVFRSEGIRVVELDLGVKGEGKDGNDLKFWLSITSISISKPI